MGLIPLKVFFIDNVLVKHSQFCVIDLNTAMLFTTKDQQMLMLIGLIFRIPEWKSLSTKVVE